MKTKEELEQLNDEQVMLEFFEKYYHVEVEMGKLKILHTLHDLKDGIEELFKKLTKGMTKKQIQEWQEQEECEEDDESEWATGFDKIVAELESKSNYKLGIEVDEYLCDISYHTKYFWIRWSGYLSGDKPKLSEMEENFEIELNDDAHFLIDLSTALICHHCEDVL